MIKKFLIYFSIFFVACFAFLNYTSLAEEFEYWLFSESGQTNAMTVAAAQMTSDSSSPLNAGNNFRAVSTNTATGFKIMIPKLNITAPIVIEQSSDPGVIYKDLKTGVVHYAGSAMIGQAGTAVILGHSWTTPWYAGNYNSVFSLLDKLTAGNQIVILNGPKALIYRVSGSLVFNPLSNDKKIDQFIETDGSSIILVTCWPAGTSANRLAVKADLVQ